ncbi:MAG: M14 family murein peptide amidase A [Planctomycetia bacterium]|nr:M14 family murein peptide amidase A [Planctomycetia bacterium]
MAICCCHSQTLHAQSIKQPSPTPSTSSDWQILITPINVDAANPWEYSRRSGVLSPGRSAFGRVWNRPFPSTTPRHNELFPTLPPPAPHSAQTHETRQIGTSVMGIPLIAHLYGSSGPKTLIFGAIHGDEPTTASVTRQLVEHLNTHPNAVLGRRVIVIPVANPDGLARRTRVNARQIDLNRNFPAKNFAVSQKGRYFGGEQPASEPETQSLILLIDDWKPDRIITIHSIARGKHGNNFDGPADALAQLMSRHNGYAVLPLIGYPTPGSFGSWSGIDRQTPTITLELPSDATGETCWQECREALLAAIRTD